MTDPAPSYTSRQLAKLAGIKIRTLRRWLAADLLSPTTFRGPATTYGPRHLDEVRAVVRFRADNLSLEAIRRDLRKLSDDELARFARPGAPTTNEPPGQSPGAPATHAPEPGAAGTPRALPSAAATYPIARWDHVTLLPGLELRVRSDAGPLLHRIAQEIYDHYAAQVP